MITDDHGSHFEYDGRPNKRLSKDAAVERVGRPDPGERTDRVVATLEGAVAALSSSGDVAAWMTAMGDVVSRAAAYGMDEVVLSLEKLEKLGTALFARAKGKRGAAVDALDARSRKEWDRATADAAARLRASIVAESALRAVVQEIVRKCGDEYCLYTKRKGPNGKRRRLGTHPSKEAAYDQEKAIKAHGG